MFMLFCRIGEARVPGPSGPNDPSWHLGVCNPSGLQGKYQILSSIPADIVAVSESHLTKGSARALKGSLKAMRSPFKHVITGAPLAPRSTASEAGQWAGVGFVTTCPARTVSVPWPLDVYESSRVQFMTAYLDQTWITGAVVYGYPTGKTHHDALQRTEALLDFASDHLLTLPGDRFLAGDWNYQPHELQVSQKLAEAGWIEVQALHFNRTGAPPMPTCKGRTQKDVCWLSPELAMKFVDVSICNETFADHAVLVSKFRKVGGPTVRYVWPSPMSVDWSNVPDLDEPVVFAAPADPSRQFAELWKQREDMAKCQLADAWLPAMRGRGQQLKPKRTVQQGSPLKTSRSHEVQPRFHGFSILHARWFKQLRRLQNYCRWIENASEQMATADCTHGIALWHSIIKASGFQPNFCAWWPMRQFKHPDDPAWVPPSRPSLQIALRMYDTMLAEVRLLESRLHASRTAHKRHRHEVDTNLIFREVARDTAAPVETLLHCTRAKVTDVDVEESAVVLDRSVSLQESEPVWIAGSAVSVIHAEGD